MHATREIISFVCLEVAIFPPFLCTEYNNSFYLVFTNIVSPSFISWIHKQFQSLPIRRAGCKSTNSPIKHYSRGPVSRCLLDSPYKCIRINLWKICQKSYPKVYIGVLHGTKGAVKKGKLTAHLRRNWNLWITWIRDKDAFAYGDFSHYTFTRRVIIRVSLSSVQGSSRVKKRDGEEGSTNFSTV